MSQKQAAIRLNVRLYPGLDDSLIEWLEQLDGRAYGYRSQAVKEALLRGIGLESSQAPMSTPALDLADLRQIVETAVTSALVQAGDPGTIFPTSKRQNIDESEDLLDTLGQALVLREG